ncbi:hypothetical protein LSAT2_014911 [Lamellibrachia satsuma]|nr:hypothetical protein LSAT2_014911 [Lamellibrachia satsuma]
MEEELTCAVCKEIYKEPMLLGCGHSYCKVCLDNIVRNASVNGESKYHQQQQQKQQKKQLEERTLGQEICGMHQGQRAYLYCKKCGTAICPLCVCDDGIGQHVGHVVITLEDWCSGLKKEAVRVEDQGKELVQTVDDIISDVTKGCEDIESKLEATVQQFEEADTRANMLSEQVTSLESQVADLGSKLEATVQQFEEADARGNLLSEQVTSLESQVAAIQDTMNEETRQKLSAQSTLRHAEEKVKLTQDHLKAEEEQRRAMDQKINILTTEMDDMKKKMESAASLIKGYEEAKKKIQRDLEVMQLRSVENDKLNKSKTKLQSELVDMKKKLESAAGLVKGYEESKKNVVRDIEVLQMRSEQLLAENDKLNKFKKKAQSEIVEMKKQLEGAAGLVKEYEESKKNTQREIEILQMRSEQMLAEKNKLNKFTTKLQSEMVDMKTKLESAAGLIKVFEESKKKMQRDLEVLQMRSEQLLAENNKVNTFNKKLLSKMQLLAENDKLNTFNGKLQSQVRRR